MPAYVYHCQKCDWERSEVRKMSEREPTPACHGCGREMKQILSPVAGYVKNPAAGPTRRG